jgi:hypothetical protein
MIRVSIAVKKSTDPDVLVYAKPRAYIQIDEPKTRKQCRNNLEKQT